MMRIFFIFFILLASVGLGLQLQHDPGYLLIAINKWTLETTLWVAILGLVVAFLFLYLIFSFIHKICRIPSSWKHWRANRRAQKAQEKTRLGLIEFSEGNWLQARNNLIKALPDTDAPLLNYLTAARAAQEMGDNNLRDGFLREAQQSIPDAKIAVELTQAQLQLASGQWEQAHATLKHLQSLSPRHPYVLKLLMHLYEKIHDWQQLILLLPELHRHHILTNEAFSQFQNHVYLQAIEDLIRQNKSQALEEWFAAIPKVVKNNPDLMAAYSRYLLEKKEYRQAESILRRGLTKQYNEKLIDMYGMIKSNNARLPFAESLLKNYKHSSALNLCLGRLSVTNNLWGKARTYFEESIESGATPAAYLELGLLLEKLNDHPAACEAYRKGLRMVAS